MMRFKIALLSIFISLFYLFSADKIDLTIVKQKYQNIHSYDNELVLVSIDEWKNGNGPFGKWGFVDISGNVVIPFIYNRAYFFKNGLAAVNIGEPVLGEGGGPGIWRHGKWGFIDKKGKEIIPIIYDYVLSFSEGLVAVCLDGKWGFFNNRGKLVIPFRYDDIWNNREYYFYEDLARVKLDGKWGFINKNGKEIISFKYDYVYDFNKGLAIVSVGCEYAGVNYDGTDEYYGGKWGFIDKNGVEVIKPIYDHVYGFAEGFAAAKFNDKWGYIDKYGQVVIPFEYDSADYFSNGLAAIVISNKTGFINTNGEVVISPIYDNTYSYYYDAYYFNSDGYARVMLNGRWGKIDKLGNFTTNDK